MDSLPVAWVAVGCLLLILLLIVAVLYLLKVREVATLKKEVFELRDTMRMMRYEEANLARMLHTANKPVAVKGAVGSSVESEAVRDEVTMPASLENEREECGVSDEPVAEQMDNILSEESGLEDAECLVEGSAEAEPLAGEQACEEVAEECRPVEGLAEALAIETPISEGVNEEALAPVLAEMDGQDESEEPAGVEGVGSELASSAVSTQKHSINERRPAIPVDLFSAWFAENEASIIEEPSSVGLREAVELSVSMASDVAENPVEPDAVPVEVPEPVVESVSVAEAEQVAEMQAVPGRVAEEEPMGDEPVSLSSGESSGSGLNKEDERFCRKLERVVSTRLRNPNLNVDTIAAQFGIGRTNFYRKVRELTGMSPNDYLRKYRMERAAELLRSTDLPISDVCVQVGVPDAQYFSKVFKVFFELTPTAYRDKNQANQ